MNCKNCGRSLNDGAKFCPGCGQKVESQVPKAASTEEILKKPLLAPILAVVLMLAVLLGGWYILSKRTASPPESSHAYTYVMSDGAEFVGTYTGGWSDGQPNGDGEFSGTGKDGDVKMSGNWTDGEPNGLFRLVATTDTFVATYTGDCFYGKNAGKRHTKV